MHKKKTQPRRIASLQILIYLRFWLRGQDLNLRPSGNEPDDPPLKSDTYAATRQKLDRDSATRQKLDSRVASRCKINELQRLFRAIMLPLFFAAIFEKSSHGSTPQSVPCLHPTTNSFDARVCLMGISSIKS